MSNKLLVAVSAVALLASAPVLAAEVNAEGRVKTESNVELKPAVPAIDRNTGSNHNPQRNLATVPELEEGDIERGLDEVGDTINQAVENVTGTDARPAVKAEADGYQHIRGALIDGKATNNTAKDFSYITIDSRNTVAGMIGKDVRNGSGEAVAKIEDIIFDRKGEAMLVVVANGGFMGLGEKKAAFEYDVITSQNAEGDVITPLTEVSLKNAAEFSYEAKAEKNVRVIPAGGYSAAKLVKANILDNNGDSVATVRDIAVSGGKASRVIVSFNDVMGMGGENAVLFFDQLKLTQKDGEPQFQLSAAQSLEFDRFKSAATKSN